MEKDVYYIIFYIVIHVEVVFGNWELRRDKLSLWNSWPKCKWEWWEDSWEAFGETKIYRKSHYQWNLSMFQIKLVWNSILIYLQWVMVNKDLNLFFTCFVLNYKAFFFIKMFTLKYEISINFLMYLSKSNICENNIY
jgi:hypothetical protein